MAISHMLLVLGEIVGQPDDFLCPVAILVQHTAAVFGTQFKCAFFS